MNAYITIQRDTQGKYWLFVTVAHSAYNRVALSDEEARDLLGAGVPELP